MNSQSRIISIGYAAWLASFPLLSFLFPGQPEINNGIAFCAALVVMVSHIIARPMDIPNNQLVYIYIGLFGLIFFLSQLFGNLDQLEINSVVRPSVMITTMFIAACIATNKYILRSTLQAYAVISSIVLLLVVLTGTYTWGRLTAENQPNYWGMIAMSTALSSLLLNRKALRLAVCCVAGYTLYAANSRGSMLATGAGFLAVAWVFLRTLPPTRRVNFGAGVVVSALVVVLLELGTGFISSDLLRVDDPYRGVDVGYGRIGLWTAGLEMSLQQPFFGVGYRNTDAFIQEYGGSSAHNGYITMFLETGMFGFGLYLWFLLHVFKTAATRSGRDVFWLIGFPVGYCVVTFFERYAMNAGQPMSIMFLISMFALLTLPKRKMHNSVSGLFAKPVAQ
jgi:O-antigen ligase